MIRRLRLETSLDWRSEFDLVGADPGCWDRARARSGVSAFKIGPLRTPAANILKQCLLSAGADAVVARGCIDASVDGSMAIVFGTPRQLRLAASSLAGQPFGLPALWDGILALLGPQATPADLVLRSSTVSFSNGPVVMGILNITPDSFSDGGLYADPAAAAAKAVQMHSQGAGMIDAGAESTRPGARPVPPGVQQERLIPVIREIRRLDPALPISVDTSDPGTARRALDEGADMINDITALSDPGMAALAVETGTPVILMHMKGTPRDMQIAPTYDDVVGEVLGFLEERLAAAKAAGIPESHLLADPGIGFGKRIGDNLTLIRRLGEFRCLGVPLVLGHSRKSFLGAVTGIEDAASRDPATGALSALAARDADILRVHDVPGTVQAVRVALAVHGGTPG